MSRLGDGKDEGEGPRGREGKQRPLAGSCKLSRSAKCQLSEPHAGKWSCRSAPYITANDEKF